MGNSIAKYQRVASAFAKKHGYDQCVFEKKWNGYMAFHVWNEESGVACTGYPQFVLVNNEMDACFSDINDLESGLFFDKSDGTPPIDLSNLESINEWLDKYLKE